MRAGVGGLAIGSRLGRIRGRRGRRRSGLDRVTALVSLLLCGLLGYPLLNMVLRTFVTGDDVVGWSDLGEQLGAEGTLTAFRNTAILLVLAGGTALVIGGTLAWLNERTDARLGLAGQVLPIASLLVPPIAGTIAWTFLLSPRSGYLNVLIRNALGVVGIDLVEGPIDIFSWYGVVFAYAAYLVPYAYLPLAAALRSLDPALEEAARVNGSGSWRATLGTTLPAIRPAIWTAVFLVSVVCLGMYSIPSILGTRSGITVVSVVIVRKLKFAYPPDVQGALVLGLALLVVIAALWWWQSRVARSGRHARIASRGQSKAVVRLGRWRRPARMLMIGYLLSMSVVPLVGLAIVSFQPFWTPKISWDSFTLRNYDALFNSTGKAGAALQNSLWLAVVGATIGVVAAALAAMHLRGRTSLPARMIDAVLKLTGNMSHLVLAIAFVLAFAGDPFRLGNTRWLLLVAYLGVYLYQAVLQSGDALDRIGDDLRDASHTSGHGPARTLRWILLPLMGPGLIAAWILFFVHIVSDVNASAILAGTKNPVVGSTLVELYEGGSQPQVAALATVLSLVSLVFVTASLLVLRLLDRR